MILCIDIGNTNTGAAIYNGKHLLASWRVKTDREKTADEWGLLFAQFFHYHGLEAEGIVDLVISSVVPPLDRPFHDMANRYFSRSPLVVGSTLPYPLKIQTHHPQEVGADLVMGCAGAYFRYGGPVIVVDFGTATTFTAVSKRGEVLGVAIAPGLMVSAEALFSRAAKLPRIEIRKPPSPIGKNTLHAMQSGFLYGFVGQSEKIIEKMKEKLGGKTRVVATGGLADLIAGETRSISVVDPNLVLEGIRISYERAMK